MLKNGRPDPPGRWGCGTGAKDEDISAERLLGQRPTMMGAKHLLHDGDGKRQSCQPNVGDPWLDTMTLTPQARAVKS